MEIILVGHAHTAKAFKEAVEMIYGEVPNFHPIDFTPKEGLQSLTNKIISAIDPKKASSTLIITDLFSGIRLSSPFPSPFLFTAILFPSQSLFINHFVC